MEFTVGRLGFKYFQEPLGALEGAKVLKFTKCRHLSQFNEVLACLNYLALHISFSGREELKAELKSFPDPTKQIIISNHHDHHFHRPRFEGIINGHPLQD